MKCFLPSNGIQYQDYARLYYGRMAWKHKAFRGRLLRHWSSPKHPYSARFKRWRDEVERLLKSRKGSDRRLDRELRRRGLSLRQVIREIPPVFGDFF